MTEVMEFKDRLRAWRGSRRQKEAANALGVSIRTYEAWERGAAAPSVKPNMKEIEQRMGVVS